SSALVTVQVAFNWLVDNYPRLADWAASARRLGSLLVSPDRLEEADREEGTGRITHGETDGMALRRRNLSVTLDGGSGVATEGDVGAARGERCWWWANRGPARARWCAPSRGCGPGARARS